MTLLAMNTMPRPRHIREKALPSRIRSPWTPGATMALASLCMPHPLHQFLEGFTPVGIVLKHVEAGAGRGQEHYLSGTGQIIGPPHRLIHGIYQTDGGQVLPGLSQALPGLAQQDQGLDPFLDQGGEEAEITV